MWKNCRSVFLQRGSFPPPLPALLGGGCGFAATITGGDTSVSQGEQDLKGQKVGRALGMSGVVSGRARGEQTVDCAHAPHTCEWLVVCGLR